MRIFDKSLILTVLAATSSWACDGNVSIGRNDSTSELDDGGAAEGSGGSGSIGWHDAAPNLDGLVDAGFDSIGGLDCTWSTVLIAGHITPRPGDEIFECVTAVAPSDLTFPFYRIGAEAGMFAVQLRALPPGSEVDCPDLNSTGAGRLLLDRQVYEGSSFHPGEGAPQHIAAGETLVMRLHAVNTSNLPLVSGAQVDACLERVFAISQNRQIEPGEEAYHCITETLTEDVDFSIVEWSTPGELVGAVLSVGEPEGPDGTSSNAECAGDKARVLAAVEESGTQRTTGAVQHLEAGDQVQLRIHLANTSDTPYFHTSSATLLR